MAGHAAQRGFDDTVRYLSPYVAVSGYERMPIVEVKGIRIGFASNAGWSFDSAQRSSSTTPSGRCGRAART